MPGRSPFPRNKKKRSKTHAYRTEIYLEEAEESSTKEKNGGYVRIVICKSHF